MTESTTIEKKPIHLAAYIGLCFVAWIAGAAVANGVSITMGSVYAEATVPVIVGFWFGKRLMKNRGRHWVGIVAFPIVTFISALLGHSIGYAFAAQSSSGVSYGALISLVIALALSCGLFAVLNTKRNVSE